VHALVKHKVGKGVGVPDVLAIALEVEDLGVEVRRGMDTTTICEKKSCQRISS
jgi:hypothetical protein